MCFVQAVDGRNSFMLYGSIIHYIFQQVGVFLIIITMCIIYYIFLISTHLDTLLH